MRHALTDKSPFVWLKPPVSMGDITVMEAINVTDPIEHGAMVKRWAWEAWSAYHDQMRKWADT
jgi:hypothetical protein